jgi:LmbE family N-acetylglucosaminyl deacetylase
MKKKIMIIAAHPDDELIGCGGTIKKFLKKGHDVKILFLAEGVTARFSEKDINSNKALKEISEREKNSNKALSHIGIIKKNITFYRYPCCRMDTIPIITFSKIIEKHIAQFKPELIFTHSLHDLNVDHQITHKATLIATRPKKLNQFVKEILCFEILSSSNLNFEKQFVPNYFINITNELKNKLSSLKFYQKEVSSESGRALNQIKTLAHYRGMQCGFKYAESFYLIKKNID